MFLVAITPKRRKSFINGFSLPSVAFSLRALFISCIITIFPNKLQSGIFLGTALYFLCLKLVAIKQKWNQKCLDLELTVDFDHKLTFAIAVLLKCENQPTSNLLRIRKGWNMPCLGWEILTGNEKNQCSVQELLQNYKFFENKTIDKSCTKFQFKIITVYFNNSHFDKKILLTQFYMKFI
jgi:hypothetical protein